MALAAQQLREHRELFFEPDMVSLNQTLKAHVIQVASNPQSTRHKSRLKAHVRQVASVPV